MKPNKERRLPLTFLSLLLALLLCLPLTSCGTKDDAPTAAPATTAATVVETTAESTTVPETTAAPEPTVLVTLGTFDAPITLHSEKQAAFLAGDPDKIGDYAAGTEELSRPDPVTLTWDVEEITEGVGVQVFRIAISTSPDFSRPFTAIVSKSKRSYTYPVNAKLGERYYWNLTVYDTAGGSFVTETASFEIAETGPRNLNVDGVTNVRDLGGWRTEDGGRVRQGLIYRGAKLNTGAEMFVTDEGIKTLAQEFGIKSEFELRKTGEIKGRTTSVLGADVKFYACPMEYVDILVDEGNRAEIKTIFSLLADRSNYPTYIHCSIGTDRTGLISYLVNGICGVSEDDLWRDYLFSNFAPINGSRSKDNILNAYVRTFENWQGNTYAEKIYNYLRDSVGVPASHLDAVIGIMKETPAN